MQTFGLNGYIARIEVLPSTLTTGTVYWSLRNTSATRNLHLYEIVFNSTFTAAAANTRSVYGIALATGTPAGGTTITPTPFDRGYSAATVDCRFNGAGVTGLTVGDVIDIFSHMSQPTQFGFKFLRFDPNIRPFILQQNTSVVIYAHGANLIAQSGLLGHVSFFQDPS